MTASESLLLIFVLFLFFASRSIVLSCTCREKDSKRGDVRRVLLIVSECNVLLIGATAYMGVR